MKLRRVGLALLLLASSSAAEVARIVVIKVDGLPGYVLDEYVNQKDPETGRWALPWFRKVFFEGGIEVANFYTRGITLSGPSWSVLETGRNPIIRGNVEFDRYSLHSYDYLNFFPFYYRYARSRQVDTVGVEVLDGVGVPVFADAYPDSERYQGFQNFQRGVRWTTLTSIFNRGVIPHSVGGMVDEWFNGFPLREAVNLQVEQELITHLQDPNIRYLDIGIHPEFDHIAHSTNDPRILLGAVQHLDALIGRIWTAIESSPLGDETAVALVSDHGMNNDPAVFSQSWNLVDALRSAPGGGHHVITSRPQREEYKISGIYPFIPEWMNESSASFYLKGQAANYPTALVDLDGNERASLWLRNSDWNALQILLQQVKRRDLSDHTRAAAMQAIRQMVDRNRDTWQKIAGAPESELDRLQPLTEHAQADLLAKGKSEVQRRQAASYLRMADQVRLYREYLRSVSKLLQNWESAPSDQLIPPHFLGELNSIYQLQNYVVGLAPGGLALAADGSLDWQRSFIRMNYFAFLAGTRVRNIPQAAVGPQPIDFVAARVPREALVTSLPPGLAPDTDGVWIYKDAQSQALILQRGDQVRYLPVKELEETAQGELHFSIEPWRVGLPFALLEDPGFDSSKDWLDQWHSQRDWLRATHRTAYSNAVDGILAELSPLKPLENTSELSGDNRLIREFQWREREAVQADLVIMANNHWNFNVRSFNPGGNHGSFLRVSTHSALLFAGGAKTGLPRGLRITEPYDGLSYVPTMLKLAGIPGYQQLPGPVIEELFLPAVTTPTKTPDDTGQ